MTYAINNEKPAILRDLYAVWETKHAKGKDRADELHALNLKRAQDYGRAKFWRGRVYVMDFFSDWRAQRSGVNTLQSFAEMLADDNIDMGWEMVRHQARELIAEHGDDVRALFAWLAPGAPWDAWRDRANDSMLRAVGDAYRDDYESQFIEWSREHVERYADEADGLRWCWLDADGEPTTEWYDAHEIGFACTRAEYLKRDADWWHWRGWGKEGENKVWNLYASDRARIADREDIMDGFIDMEHIARYGTPEDFDPRGCRGADMDAWPDYFVNYCEAAEEWDGEVSAMRAKLKTLIRARAPLHVRAALVASVYGTPGTTDNNEGDDA